MGISITEWAEKLGISRQAAHKRIKSGKVKLLKDGTIDEKSAAVQWEQNKDELQTQRGVKPRKKSATEKPAKTAPVPEPEAPAAQEPDPENALDPISGDASFADLQKAEKAVKIRRDQLRLRREEGELVPIGEVNAWVAGMIVRAREILLRIGPELKDRLAQNTDPHECEKLIIAEVMRSLNELAEYKPAAEEGASSG